MNLYLRNKILLILLAIVPLVGITTGQGFSQRPYIIVLGIAQDAGYPQMGCMKSCCARAWIDPKLKRFVTSLAIVDPASKQWWLFEATPDIKEQLNLFQKLTGSQFSFLPAGIFITHGHIGHYTGLMQLGRESMNTNNVKVYVLHRMKDFLTNNGPWSQLVQLNNISLKEMKPDVPVSIGSQLQVTPFLVPHRDEYTETAGFTIQYGQRQVLFIPDIDKWEKFDRNINTLIQSSSLAFLDGTFYRDGELGDRSMKDIPHPFVMESMKRFASLSREEKKRVYFIHFNHTNPLIQERTPEQAMVRLNHNVATQGQRINWPN